MARFTLFGIPAHLKRVFTRLFSGTVFDVLWKLFLLALIVVLGLLAATSFGFLAAFVITVLFSAVFADDIIQAGRDIWNRNWADVKVNLGP